MDRRSNLYISSGAKARVLCGLDGTAEAVPYPKPIGGEAVLCPKPITAEGVIYPKAIAGEAVPYPKPSAGEAVRYSEPIAGEAVLCPKSVYEMASRYLVLA
jgi:hypothetical protein